VESPSRAAVNELDDSTAWRITIRLVSRPRRFSGPGRRLVMGCTVSGARGHTVAELILSRA